jgi:oligopeptide transport system ATP-binding protein
LTAGSLQSGGPNGEAPILVSARNLRKYFPIRGGFFSTHLADVRAVDGVSFDVRSGQTVGLVGESGCGKTTVGRLLLRLIEPTSGHAFYRPPPDVESRLDSIYQELEGYSADGATEGALEEAGTPPPALLKELDEIADQYSIYRMSRAKMRELRGKLQIVFQDPFSSLSPRLTVREIVAEPLEIHRKETTAKSRTERVAELIRAVGLNPEHLWRFPHEFSGGQRQRIGIARALARRPDFIVLDEPTSALDVSVQAQILNILKRLQAEENLAYLFISHHLSVVRAVSHEVVVMYLGQVVEKAPTEDLFTRPLHPYTQALLSAIPIPDPQLKRERIILKGEVPSPASPPSGCRFHTRCPAVMPVCSKIAPRLQRASGDSDHWVSCHLYHPVPEMSALTSSSEPAATPSDAAGVAMAETKGL